MLAEGYERHGTSIFPEESGIFRQLKDAGVKKEVGSVFCGPEDGLNFETSWCGSFCEAVLLSNVGSKRQNNEDACMLCIPSEESRLETRGILAAVADGMGGASAGEYASHHALRCIREGYYAPSRQALAPVLLRQAVEAANEHLYEESELNTEYVGMGTTVSVLAIIGNWAYMAQVGDSRIYLLRSGFPLRQLTEDHSLVAEQMRNGLLNEEEARNHSLKNLITRAVGIKDTIEVDMFAVQLMPNDILLLCSDGLSNMVSDSAIAAELTERPTHEAASALLKGALEAGGLDNITLAVVKITGKPPETYFQQGAARISLEPETLFSRLWRLIRRRD